MNLDEHKRRAYSQAKRLGLVGTGVQLVLLGAAIYSAMTVGTAATALGLVAFLAPVLGFALRNWSRHYYGLGERLRRIRLLEDGLGRKPSIIELLDLADAATSVPTLDPTPLDSEFTSSLPRGARRLAQITQEAAYYTRAHARWAAWLYLLLTLVGLGATFIGLWFLIQFPVAEVAGRAVTAQNWAKAAATLLVFFVAGSFADRWRAFAALFETANSTFQKCDALWRGDPKDIDVVLVVSGYDAGLGRAPAIPTLIHRLRRQRLHEAWKALMAVTAEVGPGTAAIGSAVAPSAEAEAAQTRERA